MSSSIDPYEATASARTFRLRPSLAGKLSAVGDFIGLGCSPFARHYSGNVLTRLNPKTLSGSRIEKSTFFSLPLATEMFHFTRCPPFQLSLGGNMSSTCWVPPFGDSRVKGCLPPHRDFSQAATSFIGSRRRGIHHTPFSLQLLKHEVLQQFLLQLQFNSVL